MSYGQTLDEVDTRTSPSVEETPFGTRSNILTVPEFALRRYLVREGKNWSSDLPFEYALFLEQGRMSFDLANFDTGSVLLVPVRYGLDLFASEDSVLYQFSSGSRSAFGVHALQIAKTTDKREKYWGRIETIISNEYLAAKRIELQPEKPGSLEYHLRKKEAYYVHSGEVRFGVRVGRVENHSLPLREGQVALINPGTMHFRSGIEPSVIMEISTKDDDADSHLVEDGSKGYMHWS